ncbi:MAG: citrate/2-methylcitrate synthase [Candidatus Omnitrophica bacterium]|nr:citrate/2-methylcitrate synthase [Candidatus Omnitrophota bacterium]MBD3268876.1 citrate/2-methylcitrate synthase [Candidatus Omnitrophota bacterium]
MADKEIKQIKDLIIEAGKRARQESDFEPEQALTQPVKWPVNCLVGPGLEGAIACESKIGYVNGSKGWLIYRGYDIFDLCAHSTFEEVAYLLLYGALPTVSQFDNFKAKLIKYRDINYTIRLLMGFPIEKMNAMAALRIGTNFMRQELTYVDSDAYSPDFDTAISADEDSIPMETKPRGEEHAIYEFKKASAGNKPRSVDKNLQFSAEEESCYSLISGVSTVAGVVARLRQDRIPIEPDPSLSHAGNLIYVITGRKPTPIEEKIMDIALILHADHGMNASTFATMVVASTLSDMYFAIGSGIAALNGPLHGGANERVVKMLQEIGGPGNVNKWFEEKLAKKEKIMGFGHRVYKAYDPRARVLGPLAEYLVEHSGNEEIKKLFRTAKTLEKKVVSRLGKEKKIFPNVDFYSGIIYLCLGIPMELFTPIFAVSRVSGWTARVREYLKANRIFRPRAVYVGPFDKRYEPIKKRSS